MENQEIKIQKGIFPVVVATGLIAIIIGILTTFSIMSTINLSQKSELSNVGNNKNISTLPTLAVIDNSISLSQKELLMVRNAGTWTPSKVDETITCESKANVLIGDNSQSDLSAFDTAKLVWRYNQTGQNAFIDYPFSPSLNEFIKQLSYNGWSKCAQYEDSGSNSGMSYQVYKNYDGRFLKIAKYYGSFATNGSGEEEILTLNVQKGTAI